MHRTRALVIELTSLLSLPLYGPLPLQRLNTGRFQFQWKYGCADRFQSNSLFWSVLKSKSTSGWQFFRTQIWVIRIEISHTLMTEINDQILNQEVH